MPQTITFDVNCPECGKSLMDAYNLLMDKPSIRLTIETAKGKGTIRLCSIYDCYAHTSDIEIEGGEIVNFFCPFCHENLNTEIKCELCEAPMVSFKLEMGGKVNICSRKGCKNHNVNFVDLSAALEVFYNKFGYGSSH
ncbi:MAG TPA: hypothetical protein P5050_11085 [Bacteroidia bacterium]|nr:hypothetical protein [Sphingobacteriales bacterium]HPD65816.1 hypothetical protein [Bacteroidia bacterium]HRS59749.1 hypothetical protein [Bacteroidia bacterium]HRU69215.1 hypothetical protein [Bacteroidia bacterium]